MTLKEAHTLRPGDTVYYQDIDGQVHELTVDDILWKPTAYEPAGNFPLVEVFDPAEFDEPETGDAITFALLETDPSKF